MNSYAIVNEQSLPKPTKVDLATSDAREVVSSTVYTDAVSRLIHPASHSSDLLSYQGTGRQIDPVTDIKKYLQVGKPDVNKNVQPSRIFFSEPDIRKIKVSNEGLWNEHVAYPPHADSRTSSRYATLIGLLWLARD